jgi:hypothetical protein
LRGDDRADARFVEQLWRERTDVGEDLGFELGGLDGRRLDASREAAQHQRGGELIGCARGRAAKAAAAQDPPSLTVPPKVRP